MCSAASSGSSTRPATQDSRHHLRRIIVEDMTDRQHRGCNALQEDGSGCKEFTGHPGQPRCRAHHEEYKSLNTKYKGLDQAYHKITGEIEDLTPSDQEMKLRVGTDLVACRTEVGQRFHWDSSTGNRGHVGRILRIRSEIKRLEVAINQSGPPERLAPASASDTTPGNLDAPASAALHHWRSIVDPNTPIELFSHLPDDHPGKVLRTFNIQLRQGAIAELYRVVPDLDDSGCDVSDAQPDENDESLDTATEILRFVLRGYIVWKADPDTLEDAAHTASVGTFLRSRSFEELQTYIKFFTAFTEARPDTIHFLRDAVCDYLHQHESETSVTILGAAIADDTHRPKMTTPAWDVLSGAFRDWFTSISVEAFCTCFDDVLTIKRLISFRRYGDQTVDDGLFNEKDSSLSETLCQLFGFVPVSFGYHDTGTVSATVESQYRNYATGRMSLSDPLAQALIEELKWRVARYSLLVYKGPTSAFWGNEVVHRTEEQPWIKRTRASGVREVEHTSWKVELSIETVLSDLDVMRQLKKEHMVQDYYQFIIIDRLPSKEDSNAIFREIGIILYELSKCTSLQAKKNEVIRGCIPESQQDSYTEAITIDELPFQMKHADTLRYVGARTRATDVQASFIRSHVPIKVTPVSYYKRSAILDNLEQSGLIKRLESYTPPTSRCVLIRSTDGSNDLYFDFGHSQTIEQQIITKFQDMQLTRTRTACMIS